MRCEHVQERVLEALLEGETEIPPGLRPHVEGCARCAAEIQLLRQGVSAANVIPALSAAPPPGMKEHVFAAIAAEAPAAPKTSTPAAKPAPERAPTSAPCARNLRWAMLRVASAAAGVILLCGVGLQVSAMRETGKLREVITKIDTTQALAHADRLLADRQIQDDDRWRRVLEDASMQLQDARDAYESPKALYRIAETVRTKHLVESLRSLEDESRSSTSRATDYDSLSQIRDCLQDIEDLQQ